MDVVNYHRQKRKIKDKVTGQFIKKENVFLESTGNKIQMDAKTDR